MDPGHAATHLRGEETAYRRWAQRLGDGAGSGVAFGVVAALGVGWLLLGAVTGYPRWWELVITVGMPIVTLLMIVLLQHTQNHDSRATQLKLDELIRVTEGATNRMMTVEDASPDDLDRIRADFQADAREVDLSRTRSG